MAAKERLKAVSEKLRIYHHDDNGKKHLEYAEEYMIIKCGGCGEAQHHMPHREIHEDE